MSDRTGNKRIIGIVLSTVPRYSETFFRNKIKGLQNNGFEVVLFVDYPTSEDQQFPCRIITAPDYNSGLFKNLFNSSVAILKSVFMHPRRSLNLMRLYKQDRMPLLQRIRNVILNEFFLNETVDWLHFGFGMLAKDRENVAEAMGAKMAVSFRGYDLYLSPLKHPGCYDLLFNKDVKYHVLSEEMKQTLLDYQIRPENIAVITPAIDVSFFTGNDLETEQNKEIKLITVARLHWKKGLEYTFHALKHLKDLGINFHYTIIGQGGERERLVFAAHQLDILDCLTFTGKLNHTEVKEQLEQADIYLQYSIQEGFCNSVLEAQAMGLLCVVSNAEGLSENVLHNKTGWVVPKRRPKLLADKIMDVIELSSDEKVRIRKHAVDRVRSDFNLQGQNQKFLEFYKD